MCSIASLQRVQSSAHLQGVCTESLSIQSCSCTLRFSCAQQNMLPRAISMDTYEQQPLPSLSHPQVRCWQRALSCSRHATALHLPTCCCRIVICCHHAKCKSEMARAPAASKTWLLPCRSAIVSTLASAAWSPCCLFDLPALRPSQWLTTVSAGLARLSHTRCRCSSIDMQHDVNVDIMPDVFTSPQVGTSTSKAAQKGSKALHI